MRYRGRNLSRRRARSAARRVAAPILDASVSIGLLDSADPHHERSIDDVEGADLAGRRMLTPAQRRNGGTSMSSSEISSEER